MQPGKLPGANPTHQKQIKMLAKSDYTPQQISDKLKLNLSTVLSFFQKAKGLSDKEMGKFSKVDVSNNVIGAAEEMAQKILDRANSDALTLREESLKAKEELEALKAEIAEAEKAKQDTNAQPKRGKSN